MLEPASRFEYQPYETAWHNAIRRPKPWPDEDPRIIDYVENTHGEDIERIRPALLDELARAQVPYSKMHTACALETYGPAEPNRRLYLGHREETLTPAGGFQVVTAMEMALNQIATDQERVVGVYLTGRDLPGGKLKRMMPIPTDYDHLAQRFDCEWGPTFLLIPPDSYGWPAMQGLKWVWASKHAKVYAQHERIVLDARYNDSDDILLSLEDETRLSPKDLKFVFDLTCDAAAFEWTVFFTGSASGRGEITPALTDGYDDMDFIVVADDPEEAEIMICELAAKHYGQLTKVPEVAYDTYAGKKIQGFFLYDQSGKKLIQLAIGKTMEEVCFRPDVIERNSGIWLNDAR